MVLNHYAKFISDSSLEGFELKQLVHSYTFFFDIC